MKLSQLTVAQESSLSLSSSTSAAGYRKFCLSAGLILGLTGLGKIWSSLGSSKLLAVSDPIVGIKFGQLMLMVGLAEIAIAAVCFLSKRQTLALGLVAWMSANFVVYRLGLWWMDWHRPCNCLGNLTDALHISPQVADSFMKVVLAYLLVGSYGLLIRLWVGSSFEKPGSSWVAKVKEGLFLALIFWSLVLSAPAGSNDFPDLRLDRMYFKRFLESPYPIREIAYQYLQQDSEGKMATNAVLVAEGSLQQGTFFHRYLEKPNQSPQIRSAEVSGQNSNGAYWFVDRNALQGNTGRIQVSEPGSAALIRANSRSIEGLLQLRFAGWFGLRMLVPKSVKWEGEKFEAFWHKAHWPFDTNVVPILGEVMGYTNNLPTVIRLRSPAWPKPYQYIDVHYSYGPTTSTPYYPVRIQSEVVLDTGSVRGQTVDEIRVDFGVAEVPVGGFKPSDFLPSAATMPPLTIVASNTGVYFIGPDGRAEAIGGVVDRKAGYSRQLFRWCFALFLVISLGLLLRLFARSHKRIGQRALTK